MKQSSRCGRFLALSSTLKHSIWSHGCGDSRPIPIKHGQVNPNPFKLGVDGKPRSIPMEQPGALSAFWGVPFPDLNLLFSALSLSYPLLHLPADFWVPPHYSSQVSHKAMLDLQCELYNGKYLHMCKSLAYTLAFGNHCVHSALVNCIRPSALGMGLLPLIRMRLRMSILTWPGWDQKSLSQNTQEVSPDFGDICMYIYVFKQDFQTLNIADGKKMGGSGNSESHSG